MGLSLSSSFSWRSFELIAAITTRRINRWPPSLESAGLQRLSGWRGVKATGKCVEPCNVFGLQGDQFADGIAPALRTAAPISRPAVSDHRH
jgi:hypothetical protein